jgi:hypothetical protein
MAVQLAGHVLDLPRREKASICRARGFSAAREKGPAAKPSPPRRTPADQAIDVRLAQKYWFAAAPEGTLAVQPEEPESTQAEPALLILQVVIDPIATMALAYM